MNLSFKMTSDYPFFSNLISTAYAQNMLSGLKLVFSLDLMYTVTTLIIFSGIKLLRMFLKKSTPHLLENFQKLFISIASGSIFTTLFFKYPLFYLIYLQLPFPLWASSSIVFISLSALNL